MSHTLLRRDDPSIESFRGVFFKIRRALGTTAFGIKEIRLPAGAQGIEHHEVETGHEEVYLVLDGAGTWTIDGEDVELRPGDYLRVSPEATRVVTAGPDGVSFVVVAAKPQAAYDGRESL
jgi:quercetin dioxygenase-like cupin family protein